MQTFSNLFSVWSPILPTTLHPPSPAQEPPETGDPPAEAAEGEELTLELPVTVRRLWWGCWRPSVTQRIQIAQVCRRSRTGGRRANSQSGWKSRLGWEQKLGYELQVWRTDEAHIDHIESFPLYPNSDFKAPRRYHYSCAFKLAVPTVTRNSLIAIHAWNSMNRPSS